jgi:fumarate reductase flavoprotein subunit
MSATDIVIVGGGIAGLTAGNRAAQLGLKALVLERLSGSIPLQHALYRRYVACLHERHHVRRRRLAGEDQNHLRRRGPPRPRPSRRQGCGVCRALAPRRGCKFLKARASRHHRWVLAPLGQTRPGLDWEGRASDVFLHRLGDNLEEHGGKLQRGARATRLLLEDEQCVGVVAKVEGKEMEHRTNAVVIADGGFQSSPEHLAKFITPVPSKLFQRNAESGTGDRLRMAAAAGADLRGMDRFYGHLLSIGAPHQEHRWPYPYLDALVVAGILIGPNGKRFCDEGMEGIYAANCVAQLSDPLSSTVIFNQKIWKNTGKQGLISANPHLPNEGSTLHIADTFEALAEKIGLTDKVISARVLSQTVDNYNAALKNGTIGALTPSRSIVKGHPQPILTPPFYAAPTRAGITTPWVVSPSMVTRGRCAPMTRLSRDCAR